MEEIEELRRQNKLIKKKEEIRITHRSEFEQELNERRDGRYKGNCIWKFRGAQ